MKAALLLLALWVPVVMAEPFRVAFGSCAHQNDPQPIWHAVAAAKPNLFVFLGDNIYGDTTDPLVLRRKYQQLDAIPEFQKIRQTIPLVGTWDDHDYGQNDAGQENPIKKESQKEFLRFMREPSHLARWKQEGIYRSHAYRHAGKIIQLLVLDTRYFRSPLKKGWISLMPLSARSDGPKIRGYVPQLHPDATMLGAAQWAWLEKEMQKSAALRIIASSIQVLPTEHRFEKWSNIPHERERLLQLIKKSEAPTIIISGDRHMAEISQERLSQNRHVYEITSSGLTRSGGGHDNERNLRRVGRNFRKPNFGLLSVQFHPTTSLAMEICDQEGQRVLSVQSDLLR